MGEKIRRVELRSLTQERERERRIELVFSKMKKCKDEIKNLFEYKGIMSNDWLG